MPDMYPYATVWNVDAALTVAGSLAILGAAVHGLGGEILVVRRLSPGTLSPTPFGGPRMTMAMIHVTWHLTTIAFFATGSALLLSGTVLDGDSARAIALVAAGECTCFAVLMVGLGLAATGSPRSLLRHPGPLVFAVIAALAWWGAL